MAPWHVIMGQSFGASITYQLDAGKFMELYIAMVKDFHEFKKSDFRYIFFPEISHTPAV